MKTKSALKRIHAMVVLGALCTLVRCSPDDTGRITIAGTPVSLVPPAGYVAAPEIGGIKDTKHTASIIAVETPRPFKETVTGLTEEKLLMEGIRLEAKEEVTIDHHEGVLYSVNLFSGGLNYQQWMLVLPYERGTLTINGSFLKNDEAKISQALRTALLTVKLNGSPSRDKALPFQVDVAELKEARIMPGPSVVFTADGAWTEESLQQLSFFAGASPLDMPVATEELARAQFHEMCGSCELIESSIADVTIDSLDGLEMWGYTPGKKKLKYQMLLMDSSMVYIMIGTANRKPEKFLELFKTSGRTFARK